MARQTAVQWLALRYHHRQGYLSQEDIEMAKQLEEKQIKDAITYALDEDGHTGDWKIKFANDYVTKKAPLNETESTPNDL